MHISESYFDCIAGEIWVWTPDFNHPGIFDNFFAYNQGVNFLTPDGMTKLAVTLRQLAERNSAPLWCRTVQPGFDGRTWHHPPVVLLRAETDNYTRISGKPSLMPAHT